MNISFLSAHPTNFLVRSRTRGDIKYLVVHYTANNGDTARGNARYFSRTELHVSAHYFVDDTSIWQTVKDKDQAYHTGTKGEYFHPECRNANSIGIAYEGGLDAGGNPADTRTEEQKRSIRVLVRVLCEDYRIRKVVGHRDLSPDRDGDGVVEPEEWIKLCPCYDVESELAEQKCRGRCRLFG